jgi:lysophospholipase L1-like esterase
MIVAANACSSPSRPSVTPPPIKPPAISCPDPQTLVAPNGNSLNVEYGSPTVENGTPPVTTTCFPQSGSSFSAGATTVTCIATDAVHRASSCTFLVTVNAPPRLLVARFVAFGDSITWGEDGRNSLRSLVMPGSVHPNVRFPPSQQYPNVLQQELAVRYTLQTPTVDNAGWPGEHLIDPATLPRFSSVVGGPYDVVLLMEGANDLADATLMPSLTNLRQMLRNAKKVGVRPYLGTIPPENANGCCPDRGLSALLVPGFNDQIRSMAASEGVPLVDVYQALNSDVNTFIGFDGLHPTAAGYAKIADVFFAAIVQTLEVPAATTLATGRGTVRKSKLPGVR